MKKFDFLLCYDIADSKRLRKIAKAMENVAMRIQYSIFYYPEARREQIDDIVKKLLDIIDEEADDIRIYRVDPKQSISLHSAIDLKTPTLVVKG